jgi:class 3 adenylate cyclase
MTETRKLAAIMAIDVVGYSRLMGEDEAGTARAVREHREAARPIVASHDGRIVQIVGDGLLLEFPSVVGAVECAIAIQKLMIERNAETPEVRRIVYRIGVNLGDVLIEGDAILGDGVNIAARLEGICEPGGVLISGAAHDQVRGKIDQVFVDLGDKDLKNIARPVRVYAVTTKGPAPAPSHYEPNRQRPPRLSMVVLPFANLGGDPEQEHFVDGVTENLTTDLSRIRGAVVIARNTAFTYKGKPLDVKTVGRDLNVRYVLEGSVQRGGNRMRVKCNSLTPRAPITSGQSGSVSPWPISSTCRTKSSRALRTRSTPSSPRPRRDAPNRLRIPSRWTSTFRVWLGTIRAPAPTMWRNRAAFSIARSPSIPTMSTRSLDRRVRTCARAQIFS